MDRTEPSYNSGVAMSNTESIIKRATALRSSQRYAEAIELIQAVLSAEPNDDSAMLELALNLRGSGKATEAAKVFESLIELRPNDPMLYNNLGVILLDLGTPTEARCCFERVQKLMPHLVSTNANLAIALMDEGDLERAVQCSRRLIEQEPSNPTHYINLATFLERAGMTEDALAIVRNGTEAAPFSLQLQSMACMLQCYDGTLSEEEIAENHRTFGSTIEASLQPQWADFPNSRNPDRKLRVAFVSPDFRRHAVACFSLRLIEWLDREEFDITCYLVNRPYDDWSRRFESAANRFLDANGLSPRQLSERIRSDKVDVLVDLAGYTASSMTPMFAARPAPVGIAYLGYPVSTGMSRIQYRIVDWVTDPEGAEALVTENLVRMDGCYMAFSTVVDIPPVPKRPKRDVVFGSFSNMNKIHEPTFALWGGVLRALPESRFLYLSKSLQYKEARDRFTSALERNGVGVDRLILREGIESDSEFLSAYAGMDICLDSFPYTGATTTAEAAMMGVPTVTLAGIAHRSRVSATILTAIGHPEWIANTSEEFVEIAVKLASDKDKLADIQANLRAEAEASPFMDYEDHAERFGQAVRECWHRWCANPK